MKIGIIVGSLRKESFNRRVAEYIIERYSYLAEIEIVEIGELPLFNEDHEDEPRLSVLETRRALKAKDGIIFVSPEYNHSIPGVLKNALDWFSRDDYCLMRKPYLLMGASNGSIGTARMQGHLRQVLNSSAFSMYSMPSNEFLLARIQDNMDEEGQITNEGTVTRLDRKMKAFVSFIEKLKEEA